MPLIIGILLGVFVGYFFGNIIGAVIGAIVGGMIGGSANLSTGNRRLAEERASQEQMYQAPFVVLLFSCMAKIAKSDGRVSPAEAAQIKSFIRDNFGEDDAECIRDIFNAARDNDEPYQIYFNQFNALLRNQVSLKQSILGVFCSIAAADGALHPNEREILIYAENVFGFPGYVDAFFGGTGGGSAEHASRDNMSAYYKVLDCPEDASDEQLKKAYRKKSLQFHPDKIHAKGLPPKMAELAQNEMQRINEAYDRICRSRGIK